LTRQFQRRSNAGLSFLYCIFQALLEQYFYFFLYCQLPISTGNYFTRSVTVLLVYGLD